MLGLFGKRITHSEAKEVQHNQAVNQQFPFARNSLVLSQPMRRAASVFQHLRPTPAYGSKLFTPVFPCNVNGVVVTRLMSSFHDPENFVYDVTREVPGIYEGKITPDRTYVSLRDDKGFEDVGAKLQAILKSLREKGIKKPTLYFPEGVYIFKTAVDLNVEGLSVIGAGWTRTKRTGGTFFCFRKGIAVKQTQSENALPITVDSGTAMRDLCNLFDGTIIDDRVTGGCVNVSERSVTIAHIGFAHEHPNPTKPKKPQTFEAYAYPPTIWGRQETPEINFMFAKDIQEFHNKLNAWINKEAQNAVLVIYHPQASPTAPKGWIAYLKRNLNDKKPEEVFVDEKYGDVLYKAVANGDIKNQDDLGKGEGQKAVAAFCDKLRSEPLFSRYVPRIQASTDLLVHDVYLPDAFIGIRADGGRTVLQKIHGRPILWGMHLHRPGANDIFRVQDIQFCSYLENSYRDISDMHGSAFYITGCENSLFSNIFAIGYNNGFYFSRGSSAKFHIQNVDFDSCANPLSISANCDNVYGMVSNFSGRGNTPLEGSYGIYVNGDPGLDEKGERWPARTRYLLCTNLMLSEFGANAVYARGAKTRVLLKNINASEWGKALRVEGDKFAFVAEQGAKVELDSDLMVEGEKTDFYRQAAGGVVYKPPVSRL